MKKKMWIFYSIILVYIVFVLVSFISGFEPGKAIAINFFTYLSHILTLLPFIFILIGLFEVWVKRETVEKHLGKKAGVISYFWAILLGGVTIGPMIVALPIAYTLAKKGARLSIVFTYIGASAVCRIPMTIFEASYMGVVFTIIRYAVSIPLIILTSTLLGNYLEKHQYTIMKGEK